MALLPAEFERNAKKLIKHLTGFRDKDENFQICMTFVLSNFKYHRFLEVDSHKVRRSLDGLHDKFKIYSQDVKASQFNILVNQFLATPAFSEDKPKTDTHFALLFVLLNLAETPTKVDYVPPEVPQPPDEDQIDWKAYLLEGEDIYTTIFSDTSEDEDLKEDSDDDDDKVLPVDSGIYAVDEDLTSLVTVRPEVYGGRVDRTWLADNVVVQYWTKRSITPSVRSVCDNIAVLWDEYMLLNNPFYSNEGVNDVSESQIIRETLWMLSGAGQRLFIYDLCDGYFNVSHNFKVFHLTPDSLRSVLGSFCHYGNIVRKLHSFVTMTTEISAQPPCVDTCQTYQSFAMAIHNYLKGFTTDLINIEKEVIKQESSVTLAVLLNKLSDRFLELEVLGQIYDDSIDCSDTGDMRMKAYSLICKLDSVMMAVDLYSENQVKKLALLFPIWLQTIRPYLNIIDEWFNSGRLNDIFKEFIIQRNNDVDSEDRNFWVTSFTLHCCECADDEDFPSFLQPVLRELLLTGKSLEVLNALGKLSKILPHRKNQSSLYDLFVMRLTSILKPDGSHENIQTVDTVSNVGRCQPVVSRDNDHYNALLHMNFTNIFFAKEFLIDDYNQQENELQRKMDVLSLTENCKPFHLIVQHCLYPYIINRYRDISEKFLAVLRIEYSLDRHLATLRAFYFMEAGDAMHQFYTIIFDKLRHYEDWNDVSFLNGLLEDALYPHFPDRKSRLFVDVKQLPPTMKSQLPINALNGLQLHYKMPWVVRLVVNPACQAIYDQLFTHLLQIKRAKYCLDNLVFTDLLSKPADGKISMNETLLSFFGNEELYIIGVNHRMMLLRQKILHFVNSFHNYIMTRILHSSGLDFQAELAACSDFNQVIETHTRYLTILQEQCLLTKPLVLLKEAVNKVFNLSIKFAVLWESGAASSSIIELSDIETDLSRCINFLTTFLSNIIKRGSSPHLESLAFYLSTAEHCQLFK